ncbi:GerMN domain-containing protein [Candidatus Contubernalis alkaliaceticus]|uniref:GerMN domain-containing protein n=1 Tax=Candidatus Contubernalis alkaliaceticus TaxID=338645 RepID=UPI001F4BE465|nr:GerMN domain-containing protein [Candidatus Contubernalis alkalaceticus]UNC92355.1 GerMN domain-containing protein [Candidatus Contubernalis alkalaceticus]
MKVISKVIYLSFMVVIFLIFSIGCNLNEGPVTDLGPDPDLDPGIDPGDNQDLVDNNGDTMTLTLYFQDVTQSDHDLEQFGLVIPVEKKVSKSDNAPKIALEELIKGPEDKTTAGAVIQSDAKILDFFIIEGTCVVNLSHGFPLVETGGKKESQVFMESIIMTLTEYPEIHNVWVFLDGECWEDGHMVWAGPLNRPMDTQSLTLYFGEDEAIITGVQGQYGFVSPIERELEWSTTPLINVMEQLIKGPLPGELSLEQNSLSPSLPDNISIISITCPRLEDRVVTINLKGPAPSGTLGGSIFVQSIVYSFTEFPLVDRVMVLSEGKTWDDGHSTWDEPIGR